jgi:hypothetical protein
MMEKSKQAFQHAIWPVPLSASVAACAAATIPVVPNMTTYRTHIMSRGQYAALGHSTLLVEGDSHA